LYKNKINIDLDLKKKLDRFYLTLPENYDIWYKEIAPDTEDKVCRRERLMWKASERDIKNIKIHAGTSGNRSHWETLKLFVIGIFIALIGISFGVVKKSDEENKEARYLLLIIFCIIVGGLGLYMRTFPIETHWLLWTIFILVVITIIYFKGKKFFNKFLKWDQSFPISLKNIYKLQHPYTIGWSGGKLLLNSHTPCLRALYNDNGILVAK